MPKRVEANKTNSSNLVISEHAVQRTDLRRGAFASSLP
jgi:hypothetical protein